MALCGGYTDGVVRLIAGGSMMGYALPDDDVPVTKATNCLIAATADEVRTDTYEWPCIRCGDCAMVCPSRLLPQDLLVAATSKGICRLTFDEDERALKRRFPNATIVPDDGTI